LAALCGTAEAVPFPVKIRVGIVINFSGAASELHGSFVGSRPLSRATPLPQDDKAKSKQVPHRAVGPTRNDISWSEMSNFEQSAFAMPLSMSVN
jgi:hypothetical protein